MRSRCNDSAKSTLKGLASLLNAKLPSGFDEPLGFGFVSEFRFRSCFYFWLCGFCHIASGRLDLEVACLEDRR